MPIDPNELTPINAELGTEHNQPEPEELEGETTSNIDDFDVVENPDGTATVIPKEDEDAPDESNGDFYDNLVGGFIEPDDLLLGELSSDYIKFIEVDKDARKKRDEQYATAIERSGLGDEAPGGADFEGANKVTHPLMSEAIIDFAARAIKEICPPDGPVKTKIVGKNDPKKLRKAERKQRHMNWQITTQMQEFRPNMEQILTQCPVGGVQYSKMYFWKRGNRPKFEFIPMDDIYIPFHAPNFYAATRKTHAQRLTAIDFDERVASGLYYDYDIDGQTDAMQGISRSEEANRKVEGKEDNNYDEDGLRTNYEVYCWLELDDSKVTGDYKYAPYIMTIDGPSEKILSIYRNWSPDDKMMMPLDWIIEWPFIPWRGAYAIGLSHLIGSLSSSATGALRALLDSAHINNAATGLRLKGSQISGQSNTISIGSINEIDGAPGVDDIRKIMMPMPFNPPSGVLLELLGIITQYGKGIVRTAIEQDPEYSPNTPPGTEMSRVEQGLVVYSSIHSRLHEAMRRNLNILHRLNSMYLDDTPEEHMGMDEAKQHGSDVDDELSVPLAFKQDYEGEMDVQPVSDPNIFTEAQRYGQLQAVGQLIGQAPQLYDIRAYHKRMLQLLKVPGIDELMPDPGAPQDENPAAENIKMAMGQKAFVLPDQDHLAHLQVLMDFMKDPMYGKNPAIQNKFIPAAVDHAIEHMLFLYGDEVRLLIEQAAHMPIKELMGDEPELKELMSKTIAASSPLALKNTEGLLAGIMPILQEAIKLVQSMQPPMAMDPTQVAQKEMMQTLQLEQQRSQAAQALKESEFQADQQIENIKAMSAEKIETIKANAIMARTTADNETAMAIASMRMSSGQSPGVSNGEGIAKSYAQGGLIENMPASDLDHLQSHGVFDTMHGNQNQIINSLGAMMASKPDYNPIIDAIKSIPQPVIPEHKPVDLAPVVDAIHQTRAQPVDFTPVISAIKDSKVNIPDLDISPIHDLLSTHGDQTKKSLDVLANGINEVGNRTLESHQEILDALNKNGQKKNVKFTTSRDADGNLTGRIIEEDEEGAPVKNINSDNTTNTAGPMGK